MALRSSSDRVSYMLMLLLRAVNERRAAGGVWVDAPVLSQLYRTASDGMLGFRQCRKIEDVPFPWPYAQLVFVMLGIFGATFPLIAAAKASGESGTMEWLPSVLTFITMLAYLGLHKVGPTHLL